MTSARNGRRGFTLLEVLVGLVIGAMALTAATILFLTLADRADAARAESLRTDGDANAERLVRTLVGNLQVTPERSPALEGDARGVRFDSWCDAPDGWPERCSVRLFFRNAADTRALVLETSPLGAAAGPSGNGRAELELWRGFGSGRLLYLATARQGGRWTDRWSDPRLPPALAVVLDGDTLILSLGRER